MYLIYILPESTTCAIGIRHGNIQVISITYINLENIIGP